MKKILLAISMLAAGYMQATTYTVTTVNNTEEDACTKVFFTKNPTEEFNFIKNNQN